MKISLSNFNAQNTPVNVQSIGNILLIVAAIGAAIIALPSTLPSFVEPPWLLTLGTWMAAIGSLGKVITKFVGITNAQEVAALVTQTNKQLDKQTDDTVATTPLSVTPAPPITKIT